MADVPSNFATDARFEGDIRGNETRFGSFSSTLEFLGDEDWVVVRLVAGTKYTFTVHSYDPVTFRADPALTLLDGKGTQVAFTDDGGVGFNSFLTYMPASSGVYFVAVNNFAKVPGEYVVTVSDDATLLTPHKLSSGNETYTGNFNEQILGGLGNDTINMGSAQEAYGDVGDDVITGGAINGSRLFGGLGNDTIKGSGADEDISGDAGNDILNGNSGQDSIFGGSGADVIDGGVGVDDLHGGAGNDKITGGVEDDVLYGGDGDDKLDGGAGSDTMSGDAGNDTYVVDTASDKVSEQYGAGIDLVLSSMTFSLANAAVVFGAVENLTLTGAAKIDGTGNALANVISGNGVRNVLAGGLGNDTIDGGAGMDTLVGGGGDDILIGGLGVDTLTGGVGKDFFVLNATLAAANRDVIADFNHAADTIRLENAVMTKLGPVGALKAAAFFAGAAAHDADDRIIYNKANGVLSYDENGNAAGGVTQLATLTGKPTLLVDDFVVI